MSVTQPKLRKDKNQKLVRCLLSSEEKLKQEETINSEDGAVMFKLTSAMKPDTCFQVKLKMEDKIKNAMKKFGKHFNVSRNALTFMLGGVELTGKELVRELDGREIIVHGGFS